MKPWERFAAASPADASPSGDASKPWNKFAAAGSLEQDLGVKREAQDEIVEEMHPELTTIDRLAVKNFGDNNEASVNFLQKRHPDLSIKVDDASREIIARKRDGSEKDWRRLDPQDRPGLDRLSS